jgi:hypothetical protein
MPLDADHGHGVPTMFLFGLPMAASRDYHRLGGCADVTPVCGGKEVVVSECHCVARRVVVGSWSSGGDLDEICSS